MFKIPQQNYFVCFSIYIAAIFVKMHPIVSICRFIASIVCANCNWPIVLCRYTIIIHPDEFLMYLWYWWKELEKTEAQLIIFCANSHQIIFLCTTKNLPSNLKLSSSFNLSWSQFSFLLQMQTHHLLKEVDNHISYSMLDFAWQETVVPTSPIWMYLVVDWFLIN